MIAERKIYPLAEIFQPMSDEAFAGLVDDIRESGLREPNVLREDNALDGAIAFAPALSSASRNKWRAQGTAVAGQKKSSVRRV